MIEELAPGLRRWTAYHGDQVLELPVQRVLVAHGKPVPRGGERTLERLLA